MRYAIPALLALTILFVAQRAGSAGKDKPTGVTVDKEKRTVTIDAKVAPRKLDYLQKKGEPAVIYPIEVIACWPHPRGKKAHETVVTIDALPSAVHEALVELGLKPGTPVMGESDNPPQGPVVKVYVEVTDDAGEPRRVPIEKTLLDKTGKHPKLEWRFTGSAVKQADPTKPEKMYGADISGTLGVIFPVSNDTVLQTKLTMRDEKYLKLETNTKVLPKEGTPVKLVIEALKVK